MVTLILDEPDAQEDDHIWNIYYHLFLHRAARDRLLERARKLHALAACLGTWRSSQYGKLIRFCDASTLERVAEVWAFYVSAITDKQDLLRESFRVISETHARMGGNSSWVKANGRRATEPASCDVPTDDALRGLFEHFSKYGMLTFNAMTPDLAVFANPMLASPDSTARLHFGLDPLVGFHLSLACVPLTIFTPLPSKETEVKKVMERMVTIARLEFMTWIISFRRRAQKGTVILRFFVGDALPFCHTLQQQRVTLTDKTAGWYRSRVNTMEPLVLAEERRGAHLPAPLYFNVIDTSNLFDHVGAINLLSAASPLLAEDASSSLYTETMAQWLGETSRELLNQRLGGHVPTTSLLLGLFPVEYWTNTTPYADGAGQATAPTMLYGVFAPKKQFYVRTTWKRPPSNSGSSLEPLHIAEEELAAMLARIYIYMFPTENVEVWFNTPSLRGGPSLRPHSFPLYTRASFAAFLKVVKSRVSADWNRVIKALLARIGPGSSLLMPR